MPQFPDNHYRAPQSSLQSVQAADEVTPTMAKTLASAGIWARFTSVVLFISFAFTLLAGVVMLFGGASALTGRSARVPGTLLVFIVLLVFVGAWITWLLAHAIHRYAKAAKALRHDADEEYVEQCFFCSTRFFKIFGILYIGSFVAGIVAALMVGGLR